MKNHTVTREQIAGLASLPPVVLSAVIRLHLRVWEHGGALPVPDDLQNIDILEPLSAIEAEAALRFFTQTGNCLTSDMLAASLLLSATKKQAGRKGGLTKASTARSARGLHPSTASKLLKTKETGAASTASQNPSTASKLLYLRPDLEPSTARSVPSAAENSRISDRYYMEDSLKEKPKTEKSLTLETPSSIGNFLHTRSGRTEDEDQIPPSAGSEPLDRSGKPYAFAGQIVRLNRRDYDAMKQANPNLVRAGIFDSELRTIDGWLAHVPDDPVKAAKRERDRKSWFHALSSLLARKNSGMPTGQAEPVPVWKDAYMPDGRTLRPGWERYWRLNPSTGKVERKVARGI